MSGVGGAQISGAVQDVYKRQNIDKQSYIDEAEKELLHTYNRFSLVLDHGEGCLLYTSQ